MAHQEFDLSELLDALRAGGDIDIIRRSVEMVLQALIDAEATEVIGLSAFQGWIVGRSVQSGLPA